MGESYAIQASNLTKYYGNLLAVDHLDFEVRSGEVFGFLGPNGAGKTTTVRMLTSLVEPTEGEVLINGYDVSRQPYQAKRQFGVVPEEASVYTEVSTWENLMFTARLYRVPRGERERRASARRPVPKYRVELFDSCTFVSVQVQYRQTSVCPVERTELWLNNLPINFPWYSSLNRKGATPSLVQSCRN